MTSRLVEKVQKQKIASEKTLRLHKKWLWQWKLPRTQNTKK